MESNAFELVLETTVAPKAEVHRCQLFRAPKGASEIFIVGGEHEMSSGAHHYLVYRTKLTSIPPELEAQNDCTEHGEVMRFAVGYVGGGQTPHEKGKFPPGVGLPIASEEILLVQGHFLNPGDAPARARVRVAFETAPASSIEHRAGVLQFYNPFIYVPPRATASATMRCPIRRDITLLSAGPHMHKHGVAYAAFLDPPSGEAKQPFYTSNDFDHPIFWQGRQPVAAGSHVRFRCDYRNDDATPVTQGLSAETNEMCMFGAYYYPAMDRGDELCAKMDDHGSGARSCAETTSCLEKCPAGDRPKFARASWEVGECWQRCIADSCPNATSALFPQLTCTEQKCEEECAEMGEACRSCVASKCTREALDCQNLACDGPRD